MNLSYAGIDALESREGVRTKAYKDTKGIWTIGVGHTGPEVFSGLVWTLDKVSDVFMEDVQWAVTAVNSVRTDLTQNQFDALVSFVFNIGATAFSNSTMKRMLNNGDIGGAAEQFDRWHIPVSIIGRRDSEKEQFLS